MHSFVWGGGIGDSGVLESSYVNLLGIPMRFACLLILSLTLVACAHEAENTGVENSSVYVLPTQTFAFEDTKPVSNVGYQAGKISRFQRTPIVPGGMDTSKFSPWGKSFDAMMDDLEAKMADQIRENNEIAAQQEAIPGYSF